MHLDLRAKCHEANERVVGKKPQGLAERGFEQVELFGNDAGVEEEEEDRGVGEVRVDVVVELVLDSGVLGIEFGREVGFGDLGVVRGKVVAVVAEGADPDLGGEVDAREGVEDGGAGLAAERRVGERGGNVGVGAEEGDGCSEGDDALARLHLGARPQVPRHSHTVNAFGIRVSHL